MIKRKWLTMLVMILVIFVFLLYLVFTRINTKNNVLSNSEIKKNVGVSLSNTFTNDQKSLNKSYFEKLQSGKYDQDNMFVKLNPYKTSPLTALVLFKTDESASISYTVVGKTDKTSITNQVKGLTKNHQLAIVGLYANYNNTVKVKISYKSGHVEYKTVHIQTSQLPKNIAALRLKVTKSDKSKMLIGDNELTILARTTKEPIGVDADGQIRWFSTTYNQHIFKTLKNGRLLMMRKQDNSKLVYNDLIITDYIGRIYKTYHFKSKTSGSDNILLKNKKSGETTAIHHDIIEMPNGDFLATVSDGSKYIEDTMVLIDRQTGKIKKVIDLKKILPSSMYKSFSAVSRADNKIDWFHQNSIYFDEKDNNIIISSRHQDMIMKLNFKTLKPIWILSGRKKSTWPKKWQKYILSYDDNTSINAGQHDVKVISSNTDGSVETILFYNNNYATMYGNKKTQKKYSEGLALEINLSKMSATQTWSYGKTLGSANFTDRIGSTSLLSNGNYLIDFGYLNAQNGTASNIVEVDSNNNVVFNLTMSNISDNSYVYRAYRAKVFENNYVFKLK